MQTKKKEDSAEEEEEKKEEEDDERIQNGDGEADVIKERLEDEEGIEGGRSRALEMNDLETIYDDYELTMHTHA